MESPEVPPRPTRRSDRSMSRDRDYARSPLNDSPFASNIPSIDATGNQIKRPPSVSTMPSIGQEGMEYASLSRNTDATSDMLHPPAAPSHTRNVAGDLPLHAPKATVSTIAAANQVAPVTRTDSVDAAGIGIGKAKTDYDPTDPNKPPSSSRAYQYRPPSAVSSERPASTKADSLYEEDYHNRIPEIGLQAPLNPMAGDVQAPSPALPLTGQRESLSRQGTRDHHMRRRSAHGHLPPGSYGLHDHGIGSPDDLEKAWYQKHPDEMAKEEHGAYGPGASAVRGDWVMSSEDLNRLVRETSKTGLTKAMPTEDGAYQVATKSISQQQSPDLGPTELPQRPPSTTHLVPESPLRRSMRYSKDDETTDDENGDNKRLSGRFAGLYSPSDEHRETDEYGTPILAPDETAKDPSWEFMKPAVSPDFTRSRDYDEHLRSGQRSGSNSRASSRPSSRPGSIHGHHGLSRFVSHDHHHHHEEVHTPLEEIEEYEPLFKDDDDSLKKNPLERFKSREMAGGPLQRFPSQDIWEDTPSSLQLSTTVGSGEEPEESAPTGKTKSLFEHPDKERARKGEVSEDQRRDFLQDYLSKHNSSLHKEQRPGMGQKFPSRDIWEDTPDSLRLETTIASSPPQQAIKSPPGMSAKPVIPPRPAKSKDISPTDKKAPTIPDRPKPQVPPRPARKSGDDQTEGLTGDRSEQSATSPPATKPKPAIPSSSKFANRAGFLNDLNSRLQSGPPAPKPREPEPSSEEEKAPLTDARKGRARGPQRRKPAEPSPDSAAKAMPGPVPFFSIVQPWTVWSIPEEAEDVSVTTTSTQNSAPPVTTTQDLNEAPEASPLATNTAGESLHKSNNAPSTMSGALAHPSSAQMDARARAEEESTKKDLQQHEIDRVGAYGDLPGPVVEQPNPLDGIPSPPPDAELKKSATKEAEGTPASKLQDAPLENVMIDDAHTEETS